MSKKFGLLFSLVFFALTTGTAQAQEGFRPDLSWVDFLVSVRSPNPHILPLKAGPRVIVKNITLTSCQFWFESESVDSAENIDYNDFVLSIFDNPADSRHLYTVTLLSGNGGHGALADLVDQRTNEIIWPNLYQPNGTVAGTSILVSGPVVVGDVTHNGIADRADLKVILDHYGQSGNASQGDVNGDGMVNFTDFQMLELNFGKKELASVQPATVPAIVPEPNALAVMLALGVLVGRRYPKTHTAI